MVYVYDYGTKAKKAKIWHTLHNAVSKVFRTLFQTNPQHHYRLFHGTTEDGLQGIFGEDFRQGDRKLFGDGIYFTLDISITSNPTASNAFKVAKTYANGGPIIEYSLKTTKDINAIKPRDALNGSIGRVDKNRHGFSSDYLRVAPTVTQGVTFQARAIYFPCAARPR